MHIDLPLYSAIRRRSIILAVFANSQPMGIEPQASAHRVGYTKVARLQADSKQPMKRIGLNHNKPLLKPLINVAACAGIILPAVLSAHVGRHAPSSIAKKSNSAVSKTEDSTNKRQQPAQNMAGSRLRQLSDIESPLISGVSSHIVTAGVAVSILFETSMPNGEKALTTVSGAPPEADVSLIDRGKNTYVFKWTTTELDAGQHTLTFAAADPVNPSTNVTITTASIVVNTSIKLEQTREETAPRNTASNTAERTAIKQDINQPDFLPFDAPTDAPSGPSTQQPSEHLTIPPPSF